jgi:hypothetical protein
MLKATSRHETRVAASGTWRYHKGTTEASGPATAWRTASFDDSGWLTGTMPIGYSATPETEGPFGTTLDDMEDLYSSVYLRKTFTVDDPGSISELSLSGEIDDGMIVWINGEEVGRTNCGSTATFKAHDDIASFQMEPAAWSVTLSGEAMPQLSQGDNVLAVHVLNGDLSSSDLKFDMALTAMTDELGIADDGDRNDIKDSWENTYFPNPGQDPNGDPDNDGVSTLGEWVCDTDPTNGASSFQVDVTGAPTGLIVSFYAKEAGSGEYAEYTRHYALQQRSDLLGDAWLAVPGFEDIIGSDVTVTYTNAAPAGQTHYRGRVWLE